MSKRTDKFLIVVFLAVITLPGVWQIIGSATGTEAHEKRKLAASPGWPPTWKFPQQFAAYYGDHFGLRAPLIQLHAQVTYRLFGCSPSDKVLVGRDGWLYYADDSSLEDYRSLTPFRPEELERWRRILEAQHDWLTQRGIRFVVVFACDKYVIYPENLPAAIRRAAQPYRVEVLADYLREHSRVPVVALREPLLAAKAGDRLYHRTDTHWNDRGAYVGYREILARLSQTPLVYDPVETMTEGWDLARMMKLENIVREENQRLEPRQPRRAHVVEVDRPAKEWNNGRVVLAIDDPALPKLVMFRDSFGSALVPFLAEHFCRSVFLWRYDFAADIIEQERPDVVIWLMTSRRLQWYVPFNPPLPGLASRAETGTTNHSK